MNINKDRTAWWIFYGVAVIVLSIGGLGLWAAMARISGAVIAPGSVEVASKIKTVQHLHGGIVGRIFVREGDRVEQGSALIRLDDTDARAELGIVVGRIDEYAGRLARLEAERDGDNEVAFPANLLAREKAGDAGVVEILRGQRSLFKARRDNLQGQILLLRQKTEQLRNKQQAAEAQLARKQEQAQIQEQMIGRKQAAAEGIVSHDARDRLMNDQIGLQSEIEGVRSEIAGVAIAINENELKILQIDRENREKVLAEISDSQTRIAEQREQQRSLEKNLQLIEISAPISGRVLNLAINTVGGVVTPGTPILQIVPDDDDFVVRARVRTVDVDQVAAGKPARVHFSAFDPRTTPPLNGAVMSVSPAQMIDETTRQPYYLVDVEVAKAELARLVGQPQLIPGMPVEVYIETVERTPLEYILKPLLVRMRRVFKEPE